MPSIFPTADSFLSSSPLRLFSGAFFQADGSTLNTTQALKFGNCRYRQGWISRDWQVQGMTALMPSMEVQVGDFGSDVKSVSIHGATLLWIVSLSKPAECFFLW